MYTPDPTNLIGFYLFGSPQDGTVRNTTNPGTLDGTIVDGSFPLQAASDVPPNFQGTSSLDDNILRQAGSAANGTKDDKQFVRVPNLPDPSSDERIVETWVKVDDFPPDIYPNGKDGFSAWPQSICKKYGYYQFLGSLQIDRNQFFTHIPGVQAGIPKPDTDLGLDQTTCAGGPPAPDFVVPYQGVTKLSGAGGIISQGQGLNGVWAQIYSSEDTMFTKLRLLIALPLILLLLATAAPASAGPFDDFQTISPQIESIWLIDTDSDTTIEQISDGEAFDRATLPTNLSVMVKANDDTESIRFGFGGVINFHTENLAPYALGGDTNGDYLPFELANGTHHVRAMPFAADDANGVNGSELLISFSIFDSDIVVDSPLDGHDSAPGDGRCSSRLAGGIDDLAIQPNSRTPRGQLQQSPSTAQLARQPNSRTAQDKQQQSRSTAQLAGRCTLRAAIEESNALPGRQRIEVPNFVTAYQLSDGELLITQPVEIVGIDLPVIDAELQHRVLRVDGATDVSLNGIFLYRGDVRTNHRAEGNPGGALLVQDSVVELNDSEVRNSVASNGGGVAAFDSEITIRRSIFESNRAGREEATDGEVGGINQRGGGVFAQHSNVTIDTTSFYDNQAARGGGGSFSGGGHIDIVNTAIVENRSFQQGGGIHATQSIGEIELHITWSTIARNSAGTSGGGVNQVLAGGGVYIVGGSAIMANSIVAENTSPLPPSNQHYSRDCWSALGVEFLSYGANIVGEVEFACGMTHPHIPGELPNDMVGDAENPFDAGLGVTTEWDRPTVGLLASNVAVDHGPIDPIIQFFGPCPGTDVRGDARPGDGSLCDLGATEQL